jgi:hypothetical protein
VLWKSVEHAVVVVAERKERLEDFNHLHMILKIDFIVRYLTNIVCHDNRMHRGLNNRVLSYGIQPLLSDSLLRPHMRKSFLHWAEEGAVRSKRLAVLFGPRSRKKLRQAPLIHERSLSSQKSLIILSM